MYAVERRQWIVDRVREQGRVEVNALAEELRVTPETIRRDLAVLEGLGMVRRAHGGAIPVERLRYEEELSSRDQLLRREKEAIAIKALDEVPRSGTVILDAGSTTAHLADALPRDRELTVVTNSIPIALRLASVANFQVITVGGRLRSKTLAEVDAWALRSLSEITVDVAFLGTNGVTEHRGLSTADPAEAEVKRAMVRSANRVVVMADHTKWGEQKFVTFASLRDVDVLVTDSKVPRELVAQVEAAGPKVVIA